MERQPLRLPPIRCSNAPAHPLLLRNFESPRQPSVRHLLLSATTGTAHQSKASQVCLEFLEKELPYLTILYFIQSYFTLEVHKKLYDLFILLHFSGSRNDHSTVRCQHDEEVGGEEEEEEEGSGEDSDGEFSCYSSRGSGSSVEEPKKPKRTRTAYSNYQLDQLELVFTQTQYPDVFIREEMASRLGIREDRIQVITVVNAPTHICSTDIISYTIMVLRAVPWH